MGSATVNSEWSLFVQPFITSTEIELSSLSLSLSPVTSTALTSRVVNRLSPFLCYYYRGWHTQVMASGLWWLSLFGADSRLIGPISSWVDVPGAGRNLIRQRRSATAGAVWGERGSPLVRVELGRNLPMETAGHIETVSARTCQDDSSLCVCVCVCVRMCEYAFVWM